MLFPKDFDKYDAKITDKTKLTANGLEGSMIYDILAVPRHQGKYEIPPIEFTYFNTATKKYETVKSEGFTLNVAKGSGSSSVNDFTGQEDLQLLNKDIRHIKTAIVMPAWAFGSMPAMNLRISAYPPS